MEKLSGAVGVNNLTQGQSCQLKEIKKLAEIRNQKEKEKLQTENFSDRTQTAIQSRAPLSKIIGAEDEYVQILAI